MPGERTATSLLGVQTYRNRHSLHLPEASETSGLLPYFVNPWQTSCLSLPVGYTASLKEPGIDFFSAACIIKRKLSLNLSQQTRVPRMTREKQNKARHPHLQKVEFFTVLQSSLSWCHTDEPYTYIATLLFNITQMNVRY